MDCRGQRYDNGANIAERNRGLQKRILNINPLTYLSNWTCHCLNLVVCDFVKCCIRHLLWCLAEALRLFSSLRKSWDI